MGQIYLIIIIDFTISTLHFLSILFIPDLSYDTNFNTCSNDDNLRNNDKNSILDYYNSNLITRMLFLWFPRLICISMDEGLADSNVPLIHPSDFSQQKNYERIKYIEKYSLNIFLHKYI